MSISTNQQEGKRLEGRLDSIFVNAVKAVRFWFWHEAVNDGYQLMPVDYIHYRLPYSEIALLGNLPTFFYFGITLLPLKKKSCKLHVLFFARSMYLFEIKEWGRTEKKGFVVKIKFFLFPFFHTKVQLCSFCSDFKSYAKYVKKIHFFFLEVLQRERW